MLIPSILRPITVIKTQLAQHKERKLKKQAGKGFARKSVSTTETVEAKLTGVADQSTSRPAVRLKDRLVCTIKTAGNYSARSGLATGYHYGRLLIDFGSFVGRTVGTIASLPLAIPIAMVEGVATRQFTVASGVVNLAQSLGGGLGETISTVAAIPTVPLVGAGAAALGGIYGSGRGVYDASRGNLNRLQEQHLTINDCVGRLANDRFSRLEMKERGF